MSKGNFKIRVYGIYINGKNEVLVSDEIIYGKRVTKFPGGGLEFGEGTIECIKREMLEETGTKFKVLSHFYTTDFFVASAFHPEAQVISIYYLIEPSKELKIKISEKSFDFENKQEQSFRFISLEKISQDDFSLAIDQHVGRLLMNHS